MKYLSFSVKNFKGIRDLTLDLSASPRSRIHTLVGLNESGKTTVLEAINYFSLGNESLDPVKVSGELKPDVNDLIPISERANFNGQISISATVEVEDEDNAELAAELLAKHDVTLTRPVGTVTVREVYSFKNSRFEERTVWWHHSMECTTGRQRKGRRMSSDAPEWKTTTGFLRERMPPIWYFPNFLFEFPDRIYLEEGGNDSDVHAFYRAVLQDILDSLENDTTVEEHLLERGRSDEEADKRSLQDLLLEMGRHVTQRVFSSWDEIFKRQIANKEVQLSHGKEVEGGQPAESGQQYVEFRIRDADGYFTVGQRSLGFRWFFVYLLLTSYRGFRRDSPANMVFLLDEPASNLHSSAQAQLLESFKTLSDRCWIIYATHSHHLINPDWLESTWVVRNTGLEYDVEDQDFNANKTDIQVERYRQFAGSHPDQSTYFQPVLDVLDYIPSRLENIPDVAMVEGKYDFYTLNYAQSVLLGRDKEIALLPGGGSGSLDHVIRLYLGWGRDFIVLLDSDGEGEKQKARYMEVFGQVVSDRIFTMADVDQTWKRTRMEGLFTQKERVSIQQLAYPDFSRYTKTRFNRAIQEAYVTGRDVAISAASKKRFELLLDFLAERVKS